MSASTSSTSAACSPSFLAAPRELLSRQTTVSPDCTRRLTMADPMKPVPPVTKYFLGTPGASPRDTAAVAAERDIGDVVGERQLVGGKVITEIVDNCRLCHRARKSFNRHRQERGVIVENHR